MDLRQYSGSAELEKMADPLTGRAQSIAPPKVKVPVVATTPTDDESVRFPIDYLVDPKTASSSEPNDDGTMMMMGWLTFCRSSSSGPFTYDRAHSETQNGASTLVTCIDTSHR